MRVPTALPKFILLLAVFAGSGVAIAQDAIPETPPELRDFRLDPERAAPQPQPAPTTQPVVVTPPPAVSTAPERTTEQPRPRLERQNAEPTAEPLPARTSTDAPQPKVVEPVIAIDTPEMIAAEPVPPVQPQESQIPYWQIAAGLALAGMLLLGVLWLRRRRRPSEMRNQAHAKPAVEPAPVQRASLPQPVAAAPEPAPSPTTKKPNVTLDFVPEKATISFATLTVKGQLRLTNTGDAPAKGMKLRAGMISAGEQQGNAINAFHAASSDIETQALGETKPGETIAMEMELSVPLTEMQSFTLGEQKLMVPIMVANVAYRGSGEATTDIARIACMIGREATPPVPKMGALRLDLGPRSFAPLGQRPLYS